ncbi:hypothetical protein AVEN_211508-1 [Araneus ventricosus]|uniref:Uncharacterized protein n=1 Tax=Araneus ventricosus TaxID=182803 RepID=A0A4Y2JPZ9_ARAVE|nr:hypothetical protein AVEN_211508-1 [Araneus ventricosus]
MGIAMQEDDTITQRARVFTADGFTMAQWLFPFSEIEGTLIWNKVLFRLLNWQGTLIWKWLNWQGTLIWNWLNRQGCGFYQAGLNELVLHSYKCLNRFGEYVEK